MREPDFVIGSLSNPYMHRWYVLPRNSFLNLYLHKFLRDDEDRALHDHPWWFISLLLSGSYTEITPSGPISRKRFSIAFRKATHRHRVVLKKHSNGKPVVCWTLVLTGPRVREWGFWCPKGFVSWKTFTKPDQPGQIGRGCE